jgi:hypothetical protein
MGRTKLHKVLSISSKLTTPYSGTQQRQPNKLTPKYLPTPRPPMKRHRFVHILLHTNIPFPENLRHVLRPVLYMESGRQIERELQLFERAPLRLGHEEEAEDECYEIQASLVRERDVSQQEGGKGNLWVWVMGMGMELWIGLTNKERAAVMLPIAMLSHWNVNPRIPAKVILTATPNAWPASRVIRGKTSAEMEKGDVPPVGEYAIVKRTMKTPMSGMRARLASGMSKQKARISISQDMLGRPISNRMERPMDSMYQ